MKAHIVMIASGAGTADPRIAKEATALHDAGYQVTVLAWDRAGREPPVVEHDGWRIESLGPRARHGGGPRNLLKYRVFWRQAARRVVSLAPDAIHCHNLDTVPAGLLALRRLGGQPKLVLDFWEIYRHSQALPQHGVIGVVARAAAGYLERRSIPRADVVITVGEGQVGYYKERGARAVVLVENAPQLERYRPVERDEPEFVVAYIGQKRWVPALVSLMQAIQPHPQMCALLVGGGVAEEQVAEIAATVDRVEVRGRVEPAEIPALYQRCDAVYCCYDATLLNWRTAYQVKAMEAMACALPLIVTEGTFAAQYVEQHGLGYAVDDRDVADVERALVALEGDRPAAREMGRRGRILAERKLNWAAAAGRLVAVYDVLFDPSAHRLE